MRIGMGHESWVVGYVAPITHAAGASILSRLIRGASNVLFRPI